MKSKIVFYGFAEYSMSGIGNCINDEDRAGWTAISICHQGSEIFETPFGTGRKQTSVGLFVLYRRDETKLQPLNPVPHEHMGTRAQLTTED